MRSRAVLSGVFSHVASTCSDVRVLEVLGVAMYPPASRSFLWGSYGLLSLNFALRTSSSARVNWSPRTVIDPVMVSARPSREERLERKSYPVVSRNVLHSKSCASRYPKLRPELYSRVGMCPVYPGIRLCELATVVRSFGLAPPRIADADNSVAREAAKDMNEPERSSFGIVGVGPGGVSSPGCPIVERCERGCPLCSPLFRREAKERRENHLLSWSSLR
mmetsp:Transcript_69419/g.164791  ORF Transcript_69419/g.164791 Transcript_69419/m.164791 type:complete len:220 (-) Transcript_69419:55-714(-)